MEMKKRLLFFGGSALLCCTNFAVQLTVFYPIIVIPDGKFRIITREEYNWYFDFYWDEMNQKISINMLENWRNGLNWIFGIIFLCAMLYFLRDRKICRAIGWRTAACLCSAGIVVCFACFYYCKYRAEHYRLFMGTAYSAVLAVILLVFSIKAWRAQQKQ